MLPEKTGYIACDLAEDTPEFMAHLMYALLTNENKRIIDRLIEQLITEQSLNRQ
jgi:hypothetical protein